MRRKIAAGNWKMNGTRASCEVLKALHAGYPDPTCEVVICPPAPLIPLLADLGTKFSIGAQDCHAQQAGAHTGDVSAETLADLGASHVIVGHSERRADHHETDAMVRAKAEAAWRAGLTAIICIGETQAEREAALTLDVVGLQLAASVPDGATAQNTVIAYEPVWAIGSGLTAGPAEITEVHDALRERLHTRFAEAGDKMRILYGGSVKSGNAADIFSLSNVDGGLVGGASLKAEDFGPIIAAAAG